MKSLKKTPLTLILLFYISTFAYSQNETITTLKNDVDFLSSYNLKGRGASSTWEIEASEYIAKRFNQLGIELLYPNGKQDFSYLYNGKDTLKSQNIVGIIQGTDSILKEEYILIGAHYDHLGYNTLIKDGKEEIQIYRGADNNASGVAALIEIAKNLSLLDLKRSVLIVAFGAGENGSTGSWYFANRAFGQTSKISYMINLDMVGRSGGKNLFSAYTIMPNIELNDIFYKLSNSMLPIHPMTFDSNSFPSDHLNFSSLGIPVTHFTTGLHRDYNTVRDLPEALDYSQLANICEYVTQLSVVVANKERSLRKTRLSDFNEDPKNRVYSLSEVLIRPKFGNGDERDFLKKWVYSYLKYPEVAIRDGIQGRVLLEFIIEADGKISNVSIVESAGEILDKEAVKVVAASPSWKPARDSRGPVRSIMTLPIEFKLKNR